MIDRRQALRLTACALLAGPAQAHGAQTDAPLSSRLAPFEAAAVLLIGEQHDAPEHQRISAELVQLLAREGRLAALVMEMLPAGRSASGLNPDATEGEIRQALAWDDTAWPWAAYGQIVRAAVRAGRPVLGGDLPREQLRPSMARSDLEPRLSAPALAQQMQLMRDGHCQLLPESQIRPMARVQIARDISLAQTCAAAAQLAGPGQKVLLVCGSVHADKALGVPVHLPAHLQSASVRLLAQGVDPAGGQFDAHWSTGPAPASDHCAALREHFKGRAMPRP